MDHELLARELIRSLRGTRSQNAFSRRLGYRSNVVSTWESGRRWPTASETLRVAARAGVDLPAAFARFYRTAPEWLADGDYGSVEFVSRFLRDQKGQTATLVVATRAGVNRFSVARWLAGQSEPRLPDFLRMVEAVSLRLLDLLAVLVDPASLPAAREPWARREAQRSVAIEEPWTQAVLRVLEVGGLDGSVSGVAARLRLPIDVVTRCLAALERAGQVRRSRGRWKPVEVVAVDTRRTEETARRLKGFWARVGLERLEAGGEGAFAYNVFAVSEDQLRRLKELQDGYYRAVRSLVAEDAPAECVALLNLQLVRLDDGGGSA
ncbi:MAG: DUF4423 domain-containing protein [Pseudomonadota bacterium]|nr:DUF4423 domain-containing protein [Pseudomonadota bacterium]